MSDTSSSPRFRQKDHVAVHKYFFQNAPFAVLTAALPGAINYIIILFLSHQYGWEETGTFRLLLSLFSLCGLAALTESGKIFIRSLTQNNAHDVIGLLINRFVFSGVLFSLAAALFLFGGATAEPKISGKMLVIVGLACILFPLDLYQARLQADKRFFTLFSLDAGKYLTASLAFVTLMMSGHAVETAVIAFASFLAVFHAAYFCRFVRLNTLSRIRRPNFINILRQPAPTQARTYSLANMPSAALEHVDKILVGWVFGMELLGIYTLAFSTGRIIYNMIKPALYIYYRRFVDVMPAPQLLRKIGLYFSGIGILLALAYWVTINQFSQFRMFRDGASVTIILLSSYGIGMVRAVYGQAFILNRSSNAHDVLHASLQAAGATSLLLGIALMSSSPTALVLLALQYPLRDGLTTLLLAYYRRQSH